MSIVLLLPIFWVLQVAATIAFKYGSATGEGRSRRWWLWFAAGNIPGAVSIFFLMLIYASMPANPNLAYVLATSGAFIGGQIALAWIFRSKLSLVQWTGVALVAAGTAVAMLCGPSVIP